MVGWKAVRYLVAVATVGAESRYGINATPKSGVDSFNALWARATRLDNSERAHH